MIYFIHQYVFLLCTSPISAYLATAQTRYQHCTPELEPSRGKGCAFGPNHFCLTHLCGRRTPDTRALQPHFAFYCFSRYAASPMVCSWGCVYSAINKTKLDSHFLGVVWSFSRVRVPEQV